MSSGKSIAVLAFVLAPLAGCGPMSHKTTPPVMAQAPSAPPSQMASLVSPVPPPLPVIWERPIKLDTTAPPEPKTQAVVAPPRKLPRHHAKPAASPTETAQQESKPPTPTTADAPPQNSQVAAAAAQPSENSPIGQLSTDNENANTSDRNDIIRQIDETENTLNGIKRPLSADEQKTVAQIRTYVTRAREALKNDDLKGALTTSTKAHVLLLELLQ